MQRRSSRIVSLLTSLAMLGGILLAVTQWQLVFDWWRLRDYQPPTRVAQLADSATMTSYSRKLFYVHYPSLDDKLSFNEHCKGHGHSIVLGCYVQSRGIYIYDVQDERLSGIHEVTAAHEMLHAAYDRLSGKERTRIDSLTAQTLANLTNERIRQTVEQYRSHDPAVVPNELHSILGTEIRELPSELETYYSRYFAERSKVVAFSEAYESAFTERKAKIDSYDQQLQTLKAEIESAQHNLTVESESLLAERKRLDAALAARKYTAYNAGVESFNTRVRNYNTQISTTEAKIAQYNDIVKDRNALAIEEQDLVKALDSRIDAAPIQQ